MAKVEEYWFKRWQALDEDLAHLKRRVEAAGEQQLPPKYARLIGQLREFVKEQFEFFYFGFGGGAQSGDRQRLEPSLAHPPEYVLRRTLDQAAFDFTIVRLAVAQRTEPSQTALKTLSLATSQAKEYLAVVQDRFIPKGVQVITYFQRGTSIRVIPYADAALIGIPPTAMVPDGWRELLAVGHEVGHYVYQNGFEQGERLTNVLSYMNRRRPAYIRRWQEEIFADVFGALVTGHPAVFFSAYDMIADNPAYEAALDDGVHPIDALRLHVYEGVSEWLGNSESETPNAEEFHGAYEYFVTSDTQGAVQEVPLVQAAEVLKDVARDMCEFLQGRSDMRAKWEGRDIRAIVDLVRRGLGDPRTRGTPPPLVVEAGASPGERRDAAFRDFAASALADIAVEQTLGTMASLLADGQTSAAPSPGVLEVPAGGLEAPAPARVRRWFEEYRERFKTQRFKHPMPQAGWEVIFFADGWTGSEGLGPETNPPKGTWERGAGLWFH